MDSHPHLTIRTIRARAVDLAPHRPMETASGVLASTPLVLIDLLTEEGVGGTSYVRCYTPWPSRRSRSLSATSRRYYRAPRPRPWP